MKICREVARSNNSKKNLKLFKEYNRSRSAYLKWKKSNIENIWQEGHSDHDKNEIQEAIENQYNEWNTDAEAAMLEYENGQITKDQALKRLGLPSLKKRSATIHAVLERLK